MYRLLCAVLLAGYLLPSGATPPEYAAFNRAQKVSYKPAEADLLRIWVAYVGQGDAILIQFPKGTRAVEPVEMLIDGGPSGGQLLTFLNALYKKPATFENVVLTHHDLDHMQGLIRLLKEKSFSIHDVFHNGLATWSAGSPLFQNVNAANAVKKGEQRMAFYDDNRNLGDKALILDHTQLTSNAGQFIGRFQEFAETLKKSTARRYARAANNSKEFPTKVGQVTLTPLWPPPAGRAFGETSQRKPDWSHTINGNSVAFRLDYGEFSMLFTGDLNEPSEEELLAALEDAGRQQLLNVDVLKVPHHGSDEGSEAFFQSVQPVLSVASMGSNKYGHPSTKIIGWLGGPNRFYATYLHERFFTAEALAANESAFKETRHIVIETDGKQFRLVEVEEPAIPLPPVSAVRRGDGTRWIDARK